MIDDTLRKIEAAIKDVRAVDRGDKDKLVGLLEPLKAELRVHENKPEQSQVAKVLSAVEAELSSYEASHPGLVSVVNEISTRLAGLGI